MNIRLSTLALSALLLTPISGLAYTEGVQALQQSSSPLSTGLQGPQQERLPPGKNVQPVSNLPGIPDDSIEPPRVATKPVPQRKKAATPPPAKAKNPFEVPDSAIKMIPGLKERLTLPTLGDTKGAPRLMTQNVIKLGDGRNEVVYASFRQPNRISTPFKKPAVVEVSGMQIQVIDQDIYVVAPEDEPVGLFIRDDSGESKQVASLTLVPANIPGQNISLIFDAPQDMPKNLLETGDGGSHIDMVRSTLAAAINGEAPRGYDWANLNVGLARIGNILVSPRRMMSSGRSNVFIYELKNVGEKDIELSEQSFYEDGVQGVAFWPNIILKAGETSFVHIMALKARE